MTTHTQTAVGLLDEHEQPDKVYLMSKVEQTAEAGSDELDQAPVIPGSEHHPEFTQAEPDLDGSVVKASHSSVEIRYVVECQNEDGPDFLEKRDDSPFSLQITEEAQNGKAPPVVEIITTVDVAGKQSKQDYRELTSQVNRGKQEEKPSLANTRTKAIGGTRMIIYSSLLLDVIREIVEYYPSQNLIGDTVTFHEPYRVLLHHMNELRELKKNLKDQLSAPEETTHEHFAVKHRHVEILVNILTPTFERQIVPAERRLNKAIPTVLFDDVWYLLRPGSLAYCKLGTMWVGCVVQSILFKEENEYEDEPDMWEARVWFQNNSWSSGQVRRSITTIKVRCFEGEKAVTDLPIFPCIFFDRQDSGKRRESFIARGQRVCDILWREYAYLRYHGRFVDERETEYKGPIMVSTCPSDVVWPDMKYTVEWDWEASLKRGEAGIHEPERPQSSSLIRSVRLSPGEDSRDALSEIHYFLMLPVMPAFALRTKAWMPMNIDNAAELSPPEKIPDANIGTDNLRIIKSLSDRQTRSSKIWSADFIPEKGEGVVVLLHGPPGVGKTYTVETTARNTCRPLISLTITDLGSKEDTIEAELTRWFSIAHRWRAILLIDEADIFLERRHHTDISRNGIVSAFLRQMEYFGGLLFLTTNRVGFIDEAFISRVHVIIGFEKLDPFKRRDIWQTFLDKLERERAGKIRVGNSAKDFCLGDEMNAMDWNGREIRNVLQTAIALAEYDERERPGFQEGREVVVESEHFKQVMSMSKSFHAYLDSVRRDTESDRAKQFYGRNDYFRQQAQGTAQAQDVQYGGLGPRMVSQFGVQDQRLFDQQRGNGFGMNVAQGHAPYGGTTLGGFSGS